MQLVVLTKSENIAIGSVYLSVCVQDYSESRQRIGVKFTA